MEIIFVGAFFERPRANTVRPYGKGQRISHSLSFFIRLQDRSLIPFSVLSGGSIIASLSEGAFGYYHRKSVKFPGKHCFYGHKRYFQPHFS